MSKFKNISRRRFLKGFGTLISLPMLECMIPIKGWTADNRPIRIGFMHHACGYWVTIAPWSKSSHPTNRESFHPLDIAAGAAGGYSHDVAMLPARYYELFKPIRNKITTVGGLSDFQDHLSNGGGLNSGHGKGHITAYSCTPPTTKVLKDSEGKEYKQIIEISKTIDVTIAEEFFGSASSAGTYILDRYPAHHKGSSQQLIHNPSAINRGQQHESFPSLRKMYESIFQGTNPVENNQATIDRIQRKKSIVDYVLEDVNSLKKDLGAQDKIRLDEYLNGVDELGKKVDREIASAGDSGIPVNQNSSCANFSVSDSRLDTSDKKEKLLLFQDLMVKGFECSRQPIVRFDYGRYHNGSIRFADGFNGKRLKGSTNWHECSHPSLHEYGVHNMQILTNFIYDNFVKVAQKMDSITEADGNTLLDNSLLILHSSIGHTEAHSIHNQCYTLAGSLGGRLKQGIDLRLGLSKKIAGKKPWEADAFEGDSKPIANLWMTILKSLGSGKKSFGDSTGIIDKLLA